MKFIFKENALISKLAWYLKIEAGEIDVIVEHGSNVEISTNAFVEGGWDGNFEDFSFNQSTFFVGTGGKVINNTILLSTPNHTLERIYCIETQNILHFSNSLPFLLQRTDSDTDKRFYKYEEYFSSILRGLKDFKREIPLANGRKLKLFYSCNITISKDLSYQINQKNKTPDFKNFSDYYSSLNQYLNKFTSNVNSSLRKCDYSFVTTISSRYDAAACAALAIKHGC